jgi:hypothetical protein
MEWLELERAGDGELDAVLAQILAQQVHQALLALVLM